MSWVVEHLQRDGTALLRLPISAAEFRIGRALDNDLVLDDPHCAPYHASLTVDADGRATLRDLGTRNGIAKRRGAQLSQYEVQDASPFRLGHSQIRFRHSSWALAPEQPLERSMWPWAAATLTAVLLYTAWTVWRGDVGERSPTYLYELTATAASIAIWSGAYALLGRLISGVERFARHVTIASIGVLLLIALENGLELLSFATGWLWPVRISSYLTVIAVAFVVRAHLRVADPGHWPTLRWAVVLVAAVAMIVPVAQLWISSNRLTRIQTLDMLEHPSMLLAEPASVQELTDSVAALKARADEARTDDHGAGEEEEFLEE